MENQTIKGMIYPVAALLSLLTGKLKIYHVYQHLACLSFLGQDPVTPAFCA